MTVGKTLWGKTILGLMAVPLVLGIAPAMALTGPAPVEVEQKLALLGGIFDRQQPVQPRTTRTDVQYAQASDPRVVNLEEQVRTLNGKIEELNFLILQMQEQLRKQQEDNEFRFQELEGGAQPAGNKRTEAEPSQPSATGTASLPPVQSPSAGMSNDAAAAAQVPPVQPDAGQQVANGVDGSLPGVPRNLGSIRFDANGNLIGGTVSEEPVDLLSGTPSAGGQAQPGGVPGQDNTTVAALPSTDDPEELYRNSYEFILSGDYKTAEAGFRSYIDRFPSGPRVSDANFWLGESLAGQKRHRDAAEVFLATSREYPDSKKAPDTLLKLGISLAALKQREVACATFREVGSRYPKASDALKERVRQEVATNGC
jgi:tol-pal system protein YbgF